MPPAVFPVIMGAVGLGLALRRGLEAFGLSSGLAEMFLGVSVALWLFSAIGYAVKLMRRPSVLLDDLRVLPGRAGIAAAVLTTLLVAAVLVPYAPGLATGLLFLGLGVHAALAVLILRLILRAPPESREVTPVWHLHFVGFIIGGVAAVPLGLHDLAVVLLGVTVPIAIAIAIWLVSLRQLILRIPPAPLRPLLAIHLAPAALFTIVGASLGFDQLALIAIAVATLIVLAMVMGARWITASGFSALWGAFTFPLTAFCTALFSINLDVTAAIALAFTTGLVITALIRVLRAWPKGQLAAKTNAAEA
jgi:tellurite resistance protein